MRLQRKPPTRASPADAELQARLSRLRSELAQSRLAPRDGKSLDSRLDEIEKRLREAEKLATSAADGSSSIADDLKDKCLVAVHEVEAELCLFKPAALLYPTWIRLQDSLYRFEQGRREAWKEDIARLVQADVDEPSSDTLRQRLRQLTLELHEAAGRFNRLAEQRAGVAREEIKLGVKLLFGFVPLLVVCLSLSITAAPGVLSTILSLVGGVSSGAAGAVLSRLSTLRDERRRDEFKSILKWDVVRRACIGSTAALFVGAALLSGVLRVFLLPDESLARVALFVVLGFAAGFSDRWFIAMLSRVIGTRPASSPRDRG